MAKVKLNKTVFDKGKFEQTVDTSFSQLVTKPEQKFFDISLASVDDFFAIYTNLFYDIPKEGEFNSHTYLIKESTEYVGFDEINEDIQALLDEITKLREESLTKDMNILELEQKIAQLEISNNSNQPDSERRNRLDVSIRPGSIMPL